MNFSELYKNNVDAVVRTLSSMWCGETINDSQKAYGAQIKGLLKNLIAPEDAIPVVQCMNSYLPVHSVKREEAEALVEVRVGDNVDNLWQKVSKGFAPYEHQYQSWKVLLEERTSDGKAKSIVVKTGTGSGKTECFMLPLVHDLLKNKKTNNIQAIFLYPLNALMEDQKERMEQLLKGTDLTYTVYNSNLPEKEPAADSLEDAAMKDRRSIEDITGGKYVQVEKIKEDGETEMVYELQDIKFERLLYTREQIRKTPPNILLTNPTMLEYIMLRRADESLINSESKSLRWIVIDETHSYTGAGAAELAMLLRRVMLAFDVNANNIRFATSSATFGGKEEQNLEESEDTKLKKFIVGITGLDTEQIEVIDGERVGEGCIPEGEDYDRWHKIFNDDFVKLDDLYPGPETIEEKLQMLDDMCQREEDRYKKEGKETPDLKVKVHYFYRVPNSGLFVNLEEHKDGAFKIYTENSANEQSGTSAPLLELSRCTCCGEYIAIGICDRKTDEVAFTYEAPIPDESDMFDLPDDEENNTKKNFYIFGLSNVGNKGGDDNTIFRANGGKLEILTTDQVCLTDWHLVANTECKCPYCGNTLKKKKNTDKDDDNNDNDELENIEDFRPRKFRLSAEFISRLLAPSTLDQMDKVSPSDDKLIMHDGQQYLSFVDSRQAAAKATLNQNETQERLWLYTIIYHELCRRITEQDKQKEEIERLKQIRDSFDGDSEDYAIARKEWQNARDKLRNYITWEEIAALILHDKYFNKFCLLFAERSRNSDEIDERGNVTQTIKEQYVQSLMVEYLANRPANIPTPETMGLFHSCYPKLEEIGLPEKVEKFNDLLTNPGNKITDKDWRNFIQFYMDYVVRSNQSFFLKLENNYRIDIFSCERFATEKPHRRPRKKPVAQKNNLTTFRLLRYLCALVGREKEGIALKDIYDKYFDEIKGVIDALWDTLKEPKNKLLEQSQRLDDKGIWQEDKKEDGLRFNLANLSFKLYENVYLCDTSTTSNELRHIERIRPIENNFKGFSPYLIDNVPVKLSDELYEKWEPYPYYSGNATQPATKEVLEKWAKEKRSLLWNHGLWGVDGIFTYYLQDVHLFPNLFIQAEHTAQIDRSVARTLQGDFKEHTINILACSTTMEMGVDLGDLELVMLTSVPPMPANYKQRAGRSGRNNKVRSACVTLCSSDAIGLNTLYNPIEKIIRRPVCVPSVDLKSPQVVQRHINAFLIREFGVFSRGENGGSINQKVFNYYTTFHDNGKVGVYLIIYNSKNDEMGPKNKLGDNDDDTMYKLFNEECDKPLTKELKDKLEKLLRDTIYDDMPKEVVDYAREANERCYTELSVKLDDYKAATETVNTANTKFVDKLKFLYYEKLSNRLLNYWATSRFTPNANMPVNVISLDLNPSKTSSFTSNPSYSLREALSQYAPGNTMVRDGVVHMVRGVETSTLYGESKAFKQMYHDSNRTTVDENPFGNDAKEWPVNKDKALELIQPAGFLSDPNESKTRVMETNVFTHVNSQLIDADEWSSNPADPHLLSIRPNKNSGNAKIIYYNKGIGFGYCYCTRCGRAVLEDDVADKDDPAKLPSNYNPQKDKNGHQYHKAISGANVGKKCSGSQPSKDGTKIIRRNVIIGDLIQTDYSEIRIRLDKTSNVWLKRVKKDEKLLLTLGIVLSQSLANVLGKERDAVDFTIMQNGHICIFDTNPGGAGYANQLADVLQSVLLDARDMLTQAKEKNSKDMLLDKFTIRYINDIDIDAALNWIEEEVKAWKKIPEKISTLFRGKHIAQVKYSKLKEALAKPAGKVILFVDDDFEHWNYDQPEGGWKNQHLTNVRDAKVKFCVLMNNHPSIGGIDLQTLCSIEGWASQVVSQVKPKEYKDSDLYPLAYIDGRLYLTNEKEHATLDEQWADTYLYFVETKWNETNMKTVNCKETKTFKSIELSNEKLDSDFTSSSLGKTIHNDAKSIIDRFIEHCNSCNDDIEVCYQDKHLKSVFGMVITLQTIDYFARSIGKNFSLEFKVEEYTDDSAYLETRINKNMYSTTQRDEQLEKLTKQLATTLREVEIVCSHKPIVSLKQGTLPHWRELTFKCGGKTLAIRPDGGFANGWSIRGGGDKKFKIDNTTFEDEIPMKLYNDIRIAVELIDID